MTCETARVHARPCQGAARLRRSTLAAAVLLAAPVGAQAARLDYRLGLSYLHSDNIGLSETTPVSENVLMPQFQFTVTQDSSAVQMRLNGSAQYLMFQHDTYEDDWRGQLDGQLNWVIAPERMHWAVEDYLSEQAIDTLSGFSPGNLQRVNAFVTGPSFFARLGSSTRGQLDLRYTNTDAEETGTYDSDRYNAAVRVLRELSQTRQLSFNTETTRVEYDLGASSHDYERQDAYVGYEGQSNLLDFSIEAGYSWLKLTQGNDRRTSPLARTMIAWRAAPRRVLRARASYEYADATDILTVGSALPGAPGVGNPNPNGPQLPISPDTFRHTRLETDYTFTGERIRFAVQAYSARLRYVDDAMLDHDLRGVLATLDYDIRPGWRLSAAAADQRSEYESFTRKDRDRSASLALEREFSRHLIGRLEAQRRERNSSDLGQSYSENAFIITFQYRR